MKKRQSWRLILAIPLLGGCVTLSNANVEGSATLTLQPRFESGRIVQGIVTPYTRASIHHLLVKLYRLKGNEEIPVLSENKPVQAELQANLDDPIHFGKLFLNTTYRARAYAYRTEGTAELISTSSSVDVEVEQDDRPTLSALPIQLIDQIFDGQATGSLAIASGSLVPAGTESITF